MPASLSKSNGRQREETEGNRRQTKATAPKLKSRRQEPAGGESNGRQREASGGYGRQHCTFLFDVECFAFMSTMFIVVYITCIASMFKKRYVSYRVRMLM